MKHKCKCGSTTHSCPTHRDCPLNKKRRVDVPGSLHNDVTLSGSSDNDSDINPVVCVSSDSIVDEASDEWMHDNDLISGSLCVCGSLNRPHKAYCPMRSRNRSSRVLFGADDVLPAPSNNSGHSKCGKSDDTVESDKFRMCKKDGDSVELKSRCICAQ